MTDADDPVVMRHRNLEQIAMAALDAGRVLMETGANAEVVRKGSTLVAEGLGAERVYVRVGFASLAMTVGSGTNTITRMIGVGAHGVNLRLNHAVRRLCARVRDGGLTPAETAEWLGDLVAGIPRHPWWLVAVAVGLACAAFGRLLGIDWIALGPVLLGGTLGQGVRHHLLRAGINGFVVTAVVAFLAAVTAGATAHLLGSAMVGTAMLASVLLLVPGVPAMNAQTDIMGGGPTLGSARAVQVFMVLVFITVGVWAAQTTLGFSGPDAPAAHRALWHQSLFGAVASAGFAVLFNFSWRIVILAAASGALALAVRTLGLDAGWSLEAASFVAAAFVGVGIRLLELKPIRLNYAGNALAVTGCIPMVPGSAAAQGIMALLGLTAQTPVHADQTLLLAVEYGLRVVFTIGALGAGLTIVTMLLRHPDFRS